MNIWNDACSSDAVANSKYPNLLISLLNLKFYFFLTLTCDVCDKTGHLVPAVRLTSKTPLQPIN